MIILRKLFDIKHFCVKFLSSPALERLKNCQDKVVSFDWAEHKQITDKGKIFKFLSKFSHVTKVQGYEYVRNEIIFLR